MAKAVNLDASIRFYELANEQKVKKFVFASTCSNYGKMEDQDSYVNEETPLAPISLYAKLKVEVERYLLSRPKTDVCKPTCLRFSTVYGLSPRLRFDLTVNEFTKELALNRELLVYGEQFWRPYCHVRDLAWSVIHTLRDKSGVTDYSVYNVGDTSENYQKQMIVQEIIKQIPNGKVKYVEKNEDPRDYRVNFDKIAKELKFEVTRKLPDGIKEVRTAIQKGFVKNPDDPKYRNT
jgi:nucleoside-diphosphate-sugar epimerase